MKKRLLSALLVVVMLLTLVPFSAFALGDITISKQPVSQTVYAGDTAIFQIEAKKSGSLLGGDISYLWYDANEFDVSGLEFIRKVSTILNKALSTSETLVLENVTTDMNGMKIRCAAYYLDGLNSGVKISDTVTLTVKVREACAVHDLIHYAEKAPTCCSTGNIEYWQCDVCHRIYVDEAATVETNIKEITVAIDPAAHSMTHHERMEPTCKKDGNIEYWQCDHCGNRYGNPEGTGNTLRLSDIEIDNETAKHVLTKVEAKESTCCEQGNKEYYVCEVCGDYFNAVGTQKYSKSEVMLPLLAHTPAYAHDSNTHWQYCTSCGSLISGTTANHNDKQHAATCSSRAICECGYEYGDFNLNNHVNTEVRGFKEATTDHPGYTGDVWCLDCGQLVEEGHESDQLCAHKLQHFDAKEATCEKCEGGGIGNIEYWYCDKCGCYFTDENAATEVSSDAVFIEAATHYVTLFGQTTANMEVQVFNYDTNGHWKECKYCHYIYESTHSTHTMNSFATPTCCSGKTCLACGYDDGQRDSTNHKGPIVEKVGACEPEGKNPGYTGDTVCQGCGEIIQKGWEYYPKCGKCASNLKHFAAVPSTCTADGTLEYWQCKKCGNIYMDEKATVDGDMTTIVDECTGHEIHPGTDVLSAVNVASILSKLNWSWQDLLDIIKSGDLSSIKNISIDDFLDQITIKDIDHCSDDEYHWLGCQKCGKSLADIRDDLEAQGLFINEKWYQLSAREAHRGGIADCSHKAVCDICGDEYGELGTHRYDAVYTAPTCTEPGSTRYICNGCGGEDESKAEYYPAMGHQFVKGVCQREGCKAYASNPFVDVSNKSQYYTAVMWAYNYEPRIATGKDNTHFNPTGDCTRGQVVTFLWRAAGCPEPENPVNPFRDVSNTGSCAPFYTAILWAAEKGITTGYGDGTFKPNATVTRAQFVTFLWRYFGEPATAGTIYVFTDANTIAGSFQKAVAWAVEKGITTGYENNTFRPNVTCNRWQVVMFMYRAIGEGKAYA